MDEEKLKVRIVCHHKFEIHSKGRKEFYLVDCSLGVIEFCQWVSIEFICSDLQASNLVDEYNLWWKNAEFGFSNDITSEILVSENSCDIQIPKFLESIRTLDSMKIEEDTSDNLFRNLKVFSSTPPCGLYSNFYVPSSEGRGNEIIFLEFDSFSKAIKYVFTCASCLGKGMNWCLFSNPAFSKLVDLPNIRKVSFYGEGKDDHRVISAHLKKFGWIFQKDNRSMIFSDLPEDDENDESTSNLLESNILENNQEVGNIPKIYELEECGIITYSPDLDYIECQTEKPERFRSNKKIFELNVRPDFKLRRKKIIAVGLGMAYGFKWFLHKHMDDEELIGGEEEDAARVGEEDGDVDIRGHRITENDDDEEDEFLDEDGVNEEQSNTIDQLSKELSMPHVVQALICFLKSRNIKYYRNSNRKSFKSVVCSADVKPMLEFLRNLFSCDVVFTQADQKDDILDVSTFDLHDYIGDILEPGSGYEVLDYVRLGICNKVRSDGFFFFIAREYEAGEPTNHDTEEYSPFFLPVISPWGDAWEDIEGGCVIKENYYFDAKNIFTNFGFEAGWSKNPWVVLFRCFALNHKKSSWMQSDWYSQVNEIRSDFEHLRNLFLCPEEFKKLNPCLRLEVDVVFGDELLTRIISQDDLNKRIKDFVKDELPIMHTKLEHRIIGIKKDDFCKFCLSGVEFMMKMSSSLNIERCFAGCAFTIPWTGNHRRC